MFMNQIDQANYWFMEDNLSRSIILVEAVSFALVNFRFAKSYIRQ